MIAIETQEDGISLLERFTFAGTLENNSYPRFHSRSYLGREGFKDSFCRTDSNSSGEA